MATIHQLQEQYIQSLLHDLGSAGLPETEQAQIVELVVQRFNKVIVVTLVKLSSPAQRARLEGALKQPARLEAAVEELAAQVPGLHKVLEQALLAEYEICKSEMA